VMPWSFYGFVCSLLAGSVVAPPARRAMVTALNRKVFGSVTDDRRDRAMGVVPKGTSELAVTNSTADFNCDTRRTFERESASTCWRKVYDSTADEGTAIVYPDDDGPAVADVCYPYHRSERKSSMGGG
jgi:hypothetical protein